MKGAYNCDSLILEADAILGIKVARQRKCHFSSPFTFTTAGVALPTLVCQEGGRDHMIEKPVTMKTTIITILSFITIGAFARMGFPFSSWEEIIHHSTDIVVVRCGKTVPPPPSLSPPRSDAGIDVIGILKGTNSLGPSRLWTDHLVHEGENYLIFGAYNNSNYVAFEEYRVVPLGYHFSTNWIAGKSLDEQIQQLFKQAVFQLDREITEDQEQKAQLESAIRKP